jgi:hypothetical protein
MSKQVTVEMLSKCQYRQTGPYNAIVTNQPIICCTQQLDGGGSDREEKERLRDLHTNVPNFSNLSW